MHGSVLEDELAELGHESNEAHGDDPFRAEGRAQSGKLARAKAGQAEQDEQNHVQLDGEVDQQVASVEGHRREVEGHRVQDANALADQVVVARADHGDAAAGDLREKVRGSVKGGLSALLELQGVYVGRRFLAHPDIVARKDILAEVHNWRTLAHASTIPGPKAVQEVGMSIVHADAKAAEETLVDGAEGPLCSSMALADGALAACVDVLAEAQVPAARSRAILLVQRHEHAQHIGHLEGLTDERAHVAIESLHVVAGGKTQAVQLIGRLALRLVFAMSEP
mmetsp:Transcript_170644/g.542082  ORF Transcript_170644/g.542082 Transcript_170644/m.542082 type:complete len:281 (+) Transcript_170644:1290-2132(+)